jgi:HD-GYP domain-containing protein (c-di-GMP phosphodiesterase class II)
MNDPILVELLNELNIAVLEHIEGRFFKLLSTKPVWITDLLPDLVTATNSITLPDDLTYLGNFMVDANVFWLSGIPGKLDSGIWNEVNKSGDQYLFEASAFNLENRRILIIKMQRCALAEDQIMFQQAKETLLAFEDLSRTGKDLEKYSSLLEAEVQKRTADLRERVTELNCLYSLSKLIEEKKDSLEAVFEGVVNLIPDGWRYPEITCARLTVGGSVYTTQNWQETAWKQDSAIKFQGKEIGALEICYLEERPAGDEGPFLKEERSLIIAICERLCHVIERQRADQNLVKSYQILRKTFEDTISAIATIVEIRDPYTAGHQVRVAKLATAIAMEMNLPDEQVHSIHTSATIHDVGKMYVPTDMLTRPAKLSALEFPIIKTHVQNSYDILKRIEFPWPIAKITLQHHERIDGSGYPNGLKGEEILLEAKILAIADVVEAMTSYRSYRPGLGIDKALEEISKNRGILYDIAAVDVCLKLFKKKGFKFEE